MLQYIFKFKILIAYLWQYTPYNFRIIVYALFIENKIFTDEVYSVSKLYSFTKIKSEMIIYQEKDKENIR